MIFECIKEGLALTNRNLQLVLIRLVSIIINLSGIFVFLGLPVIAAIIYLGLDITGAADMFPYLLENPFEFVSRYLGLVLLIVVSLIGYLLFSSLVFLYVLSGSLGVIRNAAVNMSHAFSLSSFFKEANRNFVRLMWVMSLVLLVVTVVVIIFLLIAGMVMAAAHALSGTGSSMGIFLKTFIIVSALIGGGIGCFLSAVFSVFSIVTCIVERTGAVDSIRKAAGLLKNRPEALLYCLVVFASAAVLNIILFGIKVPFSMIPLIGPAFGIMVSIFGVVFQCYVSIAVWACLAVYYVKASNYPVYSADYEI